jgi:hypothetical protein
MLSMLCSHILSEWNTGLDKNGRAKQTRAKSLEVKLELLEQAVAAQGGSNSSSRASYIPMTSQPNFQALVSRTSSSGSGMSFSFTVPGGLQQQLRVVGKYKLVVSLQHDTLMVNPREVLLDVRGEFQQ